MGLSSDLMQAPGVAGDQMREDAPVAIDAILAAGRVLGPVPSVRIPLAANAVSFRLELIDFLTSTSVDIIAFAFSQDGGSTWINDAVNFDSYAIADMAVQGVPATHTAPITTEAFLDSLIEIGVNPDPASRVRLCVDVVIHPGSTSSLAQIQFNAFAGNSGLVPLNVQPRLGGACLNPQATVPPVLAPVNALLVLPYADGSVTPSGINIVSGTWVLRGTVLP